MAEMEQLPENVRQEFPGGICFGCVFAARQEQSQNQKKAGKP